MQTKYGILNEDVYNFDKTEFQIRVIGNAKVVRRLQKTGKALITQPENQE